MNKILLHKTAVFMGLAVFLFVLDRFFKFASLKGVFNTPTPLLSEYFSLNFAKNYFIAFSIPIGGNFLTILTTILVLTLLYYTVYLIKKRRRPEYILLTTITLGAISNLADRLTLGYVIDYLDLKYFTVFNIADAMIVFGFIGIIYIYLKRDPGNN